MKEIQWDRLAIVTATHGEKYIGYIPKDLGDNPKAYIEDQTMHGLPVILEEVRNVIAHIQPNFSQRGEMLGMGRLILLMPIDMWTGPAARIQVRASSWYFPADNEKVKPHIEKMYRSAEENEAQLAAAEAGIVPGSVRVPRQVQ